MKRGLHRAGRRPSRLVGPAPAAMAPAAGASAVGATLLAGTMLVAGAMLATAGASAAYAASDEPLGAALYESRCTGCHERSVHSRSPRRAESFEQIRAYVWRWDRYLGGAWQQAEIDAVARYLNERYYHFPCPQDVCGMAAR